MLGLFLRRTGRQTLVGPVLKTHCDGGDAALTLGAAHSVHDDVVLVDLVLVMQEFSPKNQQLLLQELP